jgi:RNA polymerase-binding transcription factor DksA
MITNADARQLLEDERRRLDRIRRALRDEHLHRGAEADSVGELTQIDQHQADVGTEVFEREKELSLIDRVETDLAEVFAAIRRVDRDEYGTCQTCGSEVGDERLRAMPATRFCVEHQTLWELARMTLAEPGGEMPGEKSPSIDEVVESIALRNLDLLPADDELGEPTPVGPEEAAIHVVTDRGHRGVMSTSEIEDAEAAEADEQAFERRQAESMEAVARADAAALARDEEQLDAGV